MNALIWIALLVVLVLVFIAIKGDSDTVDTSGIDNIKQTITDKINQKILDIAIDKFNPLTP